jgi:hypothetical protein
MITTGINKAKRDSSIGGQANPSMENEEVFSARLKSGNSTLQNTGL